MRGHIFVSPMGDTKHQRVEQAYLIEETVVALMQGHKVVVVVVIGVGVLAVVVLVSSGHSGP